MKTIRLVCIMVLISTMMITRVFSNGQTEDGASADIVTLEYMLWDANQQPAYEQAANLFMERNPSIKIEITQLGWNDYWTDIPRRMAADDGPDVFTNHLAFYSDFAKRNQLSNLEPLIKRDNVDTSIYFAGLADLWARDGRRYGLPKDWDTIAVVINEDMFREAGIDLVEVENWTWNPEDGGTFGQIMEQLSQYLGSYSFGTQYDDGFGQQQWSHLAASTGWISTDGPYTGIFHYDDPQFAETITWFKDMVDQGVFAPLEDISGIGDATMFTSGKIAAAFAGSWMIGHYTNTSDFNVRFVSIPRGPVGKRSMFNGLADSIWTGSPHQEEAWEWVKFLASPDAQNIIGKTGVVFPAVQESLQYAIEAQENRGLDVTAYTDLPKDPSQVFVFPLTDNAPQVGEILTNAMQKIFLEDAPVATTLAQANEEIINAAQN